MAGALILTVLPTQGYSQEKLPLSNAAPQQRRTFTSTSLPQRQLQEANSLELPIQETLLRLQRNSRHKLKRNVLASAQGYSYFTFIPFVSRESGIRTNLGLNNFTISSVVKGVNPSANVLVLLVDQQGFVAGSKSYVVGSNQLMQINDIITDLQGEVESGWLYITSDEPLSAWASVILNSTNDPSIELSSRFGGRRLAIQSSVKTDTFLSSLVILNTGDGGNVTIRIYDPQGQEISSKVVFIESLGLYVDADIRQSVPGTYGQIVIEAADDKPYLLASSIVKSANGTGAFFPATSLPAVNEQSVAGVWEGSLVGSTINAQVRATLEQAEGSLFGSLEVTSGTFPPSSRNLSISGFTIDDATYQYLLESDDHLDTTVSFFTLNLYAPPVTALKMSGKMLYADEKGLREKGTFTLERTGDIDSN